MKEKKKVLLVALNSKYVHTCLAVRYIKAYADKNCTFCNFEIYENTINADCKQILDAVLSEKPHIIGFSCYIWNIRLVIELCQKIKEECPLTRIILGGPEVSFNPEDYINLPYVDYVQCGDGERAMCALADAIASGENVPENSGICYYDNGKNVISGLYTECDLSTLESPYTEEYISAVSGRIAYIESTRGCPYSCAFCLSGGTTGVRYFDEAFVKEAIIKLWNSGAKTIKFVDRTFNANYLHANKIIQFILKNYQNMPEMCFHFEIAADILKESTLELLEKAPQGLFQIEAGLQSFNEMTLSAVMRKTDTDMVCENVKRLIKAGNIHTHIDLIAGLPHEDLMSFKESFNMAYNVHAHMLQLGFLKLLHGSRLRQQTDENETDFYKNAPYEVKSTRWLSESDIEILKNVEDACEKISNSGRFKHSLEYVLDKCKKTPFDVFVGFGKKQPLPLDEYTALVFDYFSSLDGVNKAVLRDKMCRDRLATNTSGKLPDCLKISDKNLAKITYMLENNPETAPGKNVKRAVCILYTENKVIYADYLGKKMVAFNEMPYEKEE